MLASGTRQVRVRHGAKVEQGGWEGVSEMDGIGWDGGNLDRMGGIQALRVRMIVVDPQPIMTASSKCNQVVI